MVSTPLAHCGSLNFPTWLTITAAAALPIPPRHGHFPTPTLVILQPPPHLLRSSYILIHCKWGFFSVLIAVARSGCSLSSHVCSESQNSTYTYALGLAQAMAVHFLPPAIPFLYFVLHILTPILPALFLTHHSHYKLLPCTPLYPSKKYSRTY
jgi:hypothetical protein